ncbi:hypothetical protein P7K49_032568 [Saguinus oedipus]|uniref:Uncharacterized protein n=1 Tax=Saguinus oedipus TaxID=9490 RepID=A0ABQ9U0H8_SAGOE|nr:hypothetical protein P7K49_032568 [Saguinus oedipus]
MADTWGYFISFCKQPRSSFSCRNVTHSVQDTDKTFVMGLPKGAEGSLAHVPSAAVLLQSLPFITNASCGAKQNAFVRYFRCADLFWDVPISNELTEGGPVSLAVRRKLHSKAYENGTNRLRLQKQTLKSEKNRPLDPEMQCLLLSDGKGSIHPNHVVILPGDSGSGTAAISFTGALKIPVSKRVQEEFQRGCCANCEKSGRLMINLEKSLAVEPRDWNP